ncbi:hypothetical protein SAMN05216359_12225 [Roseateles sp. YR242]|uniref:hypothetical protein n=1 Tax=Roseateles sp. YR242 TaxID=1855305 RepID=UPI0008C25C18|nr:hypothetical protein [Roseateles sp. YR242]SEL89429.1 hypothetical protein SAMN05216359_12225 [Roseateles sp. YR242]
MSATPSDAHGSPPLADPFSLFLTAHAGSNGSRIAQKRFNAGEHAWLGGCGAAAAVERLARQGVAVDAELFKSIPRKDERESLQYGELVALSGDFYESPEALFEERPSRLPWLWESNDLSDIRRLFAEELHWIDQRLDGVGEYATPYPDANIRLAWNAKSYVELALRNVDHFGWHNQLAYVRHHRTALELALRAKGPDDPWLRQALYTNAFADHFLTDGFAAGHIRVPRQEICDWADRQGLNDRVAGALSKVLHDQDGHADLQSLHGISEPHEQGVSHRHGLGLPVVNAADERWETFCDGQLFLNRSTQDPAVEQAVEAVADSVEELLMAWRHQQLPDGCYRATARVPWPDPGAPTLVQKFSATMAKDDLDRLWDSIAWYGRVPWLSGLKRDHLRQLFAALPDLMSTFRSHIEAQSGSTDAQRLDPRYVEGMRHVA